MTKLDEANLYTTYYLNQAGSGYGGIYSGPVYQRGYGIGSFLGGLFRAVLPLIKKGSVILGKECFKTGMDVINDVENDEEVYTSLKRRGKELYSNVKKRAMDKMTGGKYNNSNLKKKSYSSVAPRVIKNKIKSKNIKKKQIKKKKNNKHTIKKNSKVIDIFS